MERLSLRCCPQPGKAKSREILEALAEGVGGEQADGAPAFFGVKGIENVWHQARRAGRYLYVDNAYFDVSRGSHFRIGINRVQSYSGDPDWKRYEALSLKVQPWKKDGRHIVVTMQSPHFMTEVACWPGGVDQWQDYVLGMLKLHTKRPIVVRHWSPDKLALGQTLQKDLEGAWALVTYSSAAANEAVLAGVPVFATGDCAALPMGLARLSEIEDPFYSNNREAWAATLAGKQWTIDEMRKGLPWQNGKA